MGCHFEWISDHFDQFLGTLISEDISWTENCAPLAKRANQRLYFLCVLRRQQVQQRLLVDFYRAATESILTHGISVWFAACTAQVPSPLPRDTRCHAQPGQSQKDTSRLLAPSQCNV